MSNREWPSEASRRPIILQDSGSFNDDTPSQWRRGGAIACARGFTLLEVAISLFLIATALLAVFRLQAQNLDLQSEAYFITIANQLAQDRIAQIESAISLPEGNLDGECSDDFPQFICRSEVRQVQGSGSLFYVKVEVAQEADLSGRNLSVETYLYR